MDLPRTHRHTLTAAWVLSVVLSLSWLRGLAWVPLFETTEISSTAQEWAKMQNLSPAETEHLYQSLLATRWSMWIDTLIVFLVTAASGALAFVKSKYWSIPAFVVSVYVLWTSREIFDPSHWHTLRTFVQIWPKSAMAMWYFYVVPLLYVALAGTAAASALLQRKGAA
jgi:hypothetical protein